MSFNTTYPYNLPLLPPQINFKDPNMLDLVINARAELGELRGYSTAMPNPMLLLSPAIIKESLASSEIENINTTLIDVLQSQMFPEVEQHTPDKEVLRYRDAVFVGFKALEKYSLSTRAVLEIQNTLIPTYTGDYRKAQNGIENSTTKELIYTPPESAKIPELMGNLETFMNDTNHTTMDPLIRCAISHYQFEAIHPFSDGNGRTGRVLMVLNLVQQGVLSLPILYISGYINEHRSDYYKHLLNVTKNNDWDSYISFMLQAFYYQAKETKELVFKIKDLYFSFKQELKSKHKNIYSGDLVEAIFSYPLITPARLSAELGVHRDTAGRHLNTLANGGFLIEKKVGRYHFYANKDLLAIINK